MLFKGFVAARATLAAFVLFAGATPALAGRDTQVDVLDYIAPCSFGAPSCPSGPYSYQSLDIGATGHFSRAYIYSNGVVSFDSILPAGSTSNDADSLGNGTWFAPGFSNDKNYQVSTYTAFGYSGFGLNFYEQGANVFGTQDDPATEEDEFILHGPAHDAGVLPLALWLRSRWQMGRRRGLLRLRSERSTR